jgi:hypothetical protein
MRGTVNTFFRGSIPLDTYPHSLSSSPPQLLILKLTLDDAVA